jgi:hypothetical protein
MVLVHGFRKMNFNSSAKIALPCKQGDIYWDVFEMLFKVGFELIFGRTPTSMEFNQLYFGISDINRIIKRQTGSPDMDVRWKLYHASLLMENNDKFIAFFKI